MITKFKLFEKKEDNVLSLKKITPKRPSRIDTLLGDDAKKEYYNILLDGNNIGHIQITRNDEYLEVISQYVNAAYRGKGYGEKVVDLMKDKYPKLTFVTWATDDSEKFWRTKAKFSKMTEEEFDDINVSKKKYSEMYKILK